MYSILKHKQACEKVVQLSENDIKRTVKAIYGVEIYHSLHDTKTDKKRRTAKDKENEEKFGSGLFKVEENPYQAQTYHLVLLAKDMPGYENLLDIQAHAGYNSYSYANKPFYRTDIDYMKSRGKGIVALSGCLGGFIPRLILNGEYERAKEVALQFNNIFEHFYFELQANEIPEQIILNNKLIKLGKELGIKTVITSDSHYANKEDRTAHDILYTLGSEEKESNKRKKTFKAEDYMHFKTPLEIEQYCNTYNLPLECIDNTVDIANMCNVDFTPKDKKGFMPTFKVPKGYTEDTYLEKVAYQDFYEKIKEKKINDNLEERFNRLRYELDVINNAGFPGYFLIVSDFIKRCKEKKIVVGPGRGSAAGSELAYVMSITNLDPIKYDLLFERFLNPERTSLPDIDLDISSDKRAEAIKILLDTYGEKNVCQIITFNKYSLITTMKAIVANFYGSREDYGEIFKKVNDFTKEVLGKNKIGEKEITYDGLIDVYENQDKYMSEEDVDVPKIVNIYEQLEEFTNKYPELKDGLSKLRGAISGIGIHAGGIVISSKNLKRNFPMAKSTGDTAILPIIQLEMNDVEYFNLLKLDALGLGTLTQFDRALTLIGMDQSWIYEEDFEDQKIYEFLRNGNTTNVFQLQKPQATRMISDFNANKFDDLIAITAGVRPGLSNPTKIYQSLEKNDNGEYYDVSPVQVYIDIENGKRKVESFGPEIDELLKNTNGLIWYQEDCQKIGQIMAGYSLGAADTKIRKTIGKKKLDKIPEIRNEFIYGKASIKDEFDKVIGISDKPSKDCEGAINRGYLEDIAKKTFELIEAMAKYCFNKSHAGAYSVLSYKSAWLSYYYPHEFSIGCLSLMKDDKDKQRTIDYCKSRGIKFLPPDINLSDGNFKIEILEDVKCIRYGLNKLKKIAGASKFIMFIREKLGFFTSFDEFMNRIKDVQLVEEYNMLTGSATKTHVNKSHIEILIMAGAFDNIEPNRFVLQNYYYENYATKKDKNEYKVLKEEKYNKAIKYSLELNYLDTYVSGHPLDFLPCDSLTDLKDNQLVTLPGIINSKSTKQDKRGNNYLQIEFQTVNGVYYKGNIFSQLYPYVADKIKATNIPKTKVKIKKDTKNKDSDKKKDDKSKDNENAKLDQIIKDNEKRKKCVYLIKGVYSSSFRNFNIKEIYSLNELLGR